MSLIICALLGLFFTRVLIIKFDFSSILASALPSLLFTLPSYFFTYDFHQEMACFYGATFIAMAGKDFSSYLLILSLLLYLVLFIQMVELISHIGGALGFSAFIAFSISYIFRGIYIYVKTHKII